MLRSVFHLLAALFSLPLLSPAFADVFTVTNTNNSGTGSFRQALLSSNSTPVPTPGGRHIIIFDIPVNPMFPLPPVIAPTSPLPDITRRVLIDASTNQTTGRAGLSGANAGMDTDGLRIIAPAERCTIRGLMIFGFLGNGDGIEINGSNGNDIEGCRIGLDPLTGTLDLGNGGAGVHIANGSDNTLGGTTVAQRNVISGNGANGVWIIDASSTGNRVIGNYIGTNLAGTAAVPNVPSGVRIAVSPGNIVGGPTTAERNLISGNGTGITIAGANARGNVVQGNFIGTDASGFADLGNQTDGIRLESAEATIVGGTPPFTFLHGSPPGNVISGNGMAGIRIQSASTVWIMGNGIGASVSGTTDIGNGQEGIKVETEPLLGLPPRNVVIGGSFAAGNLVRFNDFDGIWIDDGTGTLVQGNLVQQNDRNGIRIESDENVIGGPDANHANRIFENGDHGIQIALGGSRNLIGGGSTADGSFIYGNTNHGVSIRNGTTGHNRVEGCRIGADENGAIEPNGEFGVAILQFAHDNIVGGTESGKGNEILGNLMGGVLIGQNATDNRALGNLVEANGYGILIDNAPDNLIGGIVVGASNIIVNNTSSGIGVTGPGAAGIKIQGNFIGLTPGGAESGNGGSGVEVVDAPGTLIGGNVSEARNFIGDNDGDGISISGGGLSAGTVIQGNYIGVNESGALSKGNQRNGVYAHAVDLLLGGDTPVERNIISGNGSHGVALSGAATVGCVVAGNFIGTDAAGAAALGNNADGVFIEAADGNVIGGTQSGTANVIAANGGNGVRLAALANGNRILGNLIGTNASGLANLGNNQSAIRIQDAQDNQVGTPGPAGRNLLSGTNEYGVWIDHPKAEGNRVQGNFIGTDFTGTTALGNKFGGVLINDASENTIGGEAPGAGNLISGNGGNGVHLQKMAFRPSRNVVQGNRIGTDLTGTLALPNSNRGIDLSAADDNLIGGTAEGAGNLVSGNGSFGILLHDEAAHNHLLGNFIGTDITGTLALGNTFDGLFLENAPLNLVGGESSGAGNLISGNGRYGVYLLDSAAHSNRIGGNSIGTDLTGALAIGNASAGILIKNCTENIIGGTTTAAGNLVMFNAGPGVAILSGTRNAILSNGIFSNAELGIDLGWDGVTENDPDDSDGSPNNLQNFPLILGVTAEALTTIVGTLQSASETTFLIQVFANEECDGSEHGEGQALVGSVTATTDSDGEAAFLLEIEQGVPGVTYFTAAATDPDGNTSEFGECFEAIGPFTPTPSPSPTVSTTASPTFTVQPTPTLSGAPTATATHTGAPPNTPTPTLSGAPTATPTLPGAPLATPTQSGALTATPTLSGAPTASPSAICEPNFDLTGDLELDAADLLLLLEDLHSGNLRSDFDCSGEVDAWDLYFFAPVWGLEIDR